LTATAAAAWNAISTKLSDDEADAAGPAAARADDARAWRWSAIQTDDVRWNRDEHDGKYDASSSILLPFVLLLYFSVEFHQ
jgi:hypothetical protein